MRHSDHDFDVLARTLYGEAKARDTEDAQAIASVVMNRVNYPNWPNSVAEVCLQPWQFSCWNANDPNRQRILNAKGEWWEECQTIARLALSGIMTDFTHTSTHYYARYIKAPKWARGKEAVYQTDVHLFFNDIDTPPPKDARQALGQVRPIVQTRTMQGAAVVASATVAEPIIEQMGQVAQAGALMTSIAQLAPWVLSVIALAALGYMIWARIDDRKKGLR